jgi:glycosyltransferase involved in cell wall biosynthesis
VSIYALMVTFNEEDRYLQEALAWLSAQVDGIFVYDDRSTDRTYEIARSFEKVEAWRRVRRPSFMEHEGQFRTAALRAMESIVTMDDLDWVFVADADEFFVPNTETLQDLVVGVERAMPHAHAIRLRIHSVWEENELGLQHRIDGPWQTLYEPRLWRWREGYAFADKAMACRNEPVMVTMQPGLIAEPPTGSAILHYGYASPRDRALRYKRYTSLGRNHGHNPVFIESIMDSRPVLVSWGGSRPAEIRSETASA